MRRQSTKTIRRNISNKVNRSSRTVGMIGSKADKLRQQAERKLEETKKTFADAESRIRNYVNSHPEKALMIAAGVGVAIGAIMAHFSGQIKPQGGKPVHRGYRRRREYE